MITARKKGSAGGYPPERQRSSLRQKDINIPAEKKKIFFYVFHKNSGTPDGFGLVNVQS